jgi:hypothetical protein
MCGYPTITYNDKFIVSLRRCYSRVLDTKYRLFLSYLLNSRNIVILYSALQNKMERLNNTERLYKGNCGSYLEFGELKQGKGVLDTVFKL